MTFDDVHIFTLQYLDDEFEGLSYFIVNGQFFYFQPGDLRITDNSHEYLRLFMEHGWRIFISNSGSYRITDYRWNGVLIRPQISSYLNKYVAYRGNLNGKGYTENGGCYVIRKQNNIEMEQRSLKKLSDERLLGDRNENNGQRLSRG